MPTRKKNSVTERAGVNYVRALIEANNSVFKEMSQQYDYGHDAFVLLVEGEQVLSKEVAMQIKAGASYCTPKTCKIPATAGQLAFWAGHDLVTLGVVYDPAEDAAYWIDLQNEARDRTRGRQQTGAVIEFKKSEWNRLNAQMFATFLIPTLQGKAPHLSLETALSWARSDDYATHDLGVQTLLVRHRTAPETWTAILDLFASRPPECVSPSVCIGLAKMMGHSDIGYYSDEVPAELRKKVRAQILGFGQSEFAKILFYVDHYDFTRPSMGYSMLSVLAGLPNSAEIIAGVRDDVTVDQETRAKAANLFAIYEDDSHWWNLWCKDPSA